MTELKDDKELNEFRVGEILIKGEVADIWGGVHSSTATPVHVVIVNKRKIGQQVDELRIEKYAPKVREITNPHVLKYHRMVQNEIQMGIIMEHPKGGSVRDYLLLKAEKRIGEQEAKVIFKQIVSALDCLHSLQIVHGGINLKNVFVDDTFNPPFVKVGDFLICSRLGLHKSNTANSCHFFPPETWTEGGNELPTDIWSLGVLLYVMICGFYPFDGKSEMELFGCIRRGTFNLPNFVSDECGQLIKMMLNSTPSERATIVTVKNHSWLETFNSDILSAPNTPPLNSSSPILETKHRRATSLDSIPEEHIPSSPTLTSVLQKMKLEGENEHTSIDTTGMMDPYSSDSDSVKSDDYSTAPSASYGITPHSEPLSRKKKSDLIEIAHRNNMKYAHLENTRVNSAPNSPTEFTPAFPDNYDYQNNRSISTSRSGSSESSVMHTNYFRALVGIPDDNNTEKKTKSPPSSPKSQGGRRHRRRSFDGFQNNPYPKHTIIPALQGITESLLETQTPSLVPTNGTQQPLRQSISADSAPNLYKVQPPQRSDFDQLFDRNHHPQATNTSYHPQNQLQKTQQQLSQLGIHLTESRSYPNVGSLLFQPTPQPLPQQQPVYVSQPPMPASVQVHEFQIPTTRQPFPMNPVQVQATSSQHFTYEQLMHFQNQRMNMQPQVQPQPQVQTQPIELVQIHVQIPPPSPQIQLPQSPQPNPVQDFFAQFNVPTTPRLDDQSQTNNVSIDFDFLSSLINPDGSEPRGDHWVDSVFN